jgi:multiple antibiotic resistance protein
MDNTGDLIKAVLLLFAVVDPIGNAPIFLDTVEQLGKEDSKKAFKAAVLVGSAVLFVFAFAGKGILANIFQIQIEDVAIAGGLLLVVIAIDNLFAGKLARADSTLHQRAVGPYELGSVPLGVPLLAGPGAMVTSLTILEHYGPAAITIAIVVVFVATWIMCMFLETIHRVLGKLVSQVFSKVMSLFIAAIGVHMVLQGIEGFIKSLR